MKARLIAPVVGVALVLALTGGFALGATRSEPPTMGRMRNLGQMVAACDAMHRSPAMQQEMEQVPAEFREQCEAMHVQMMQVMDQMVGMMGGSGMMGST